MSRWMGTSRAALAFFAAVLVAALMAIAPDRGLTSTQPPDLTQLEELTNQHLTGVYAVPAKSQIILYAIDSSVSPPWALVDWGFFPGGGEIAATKNKSGTWTQKFASGGIFTTQELVSHGIPSAAATYLKAHMQPLPTPTP